VVELQTQELQQESNPKWLPLKGSCPSGRASNGSPCMKEMEMRAGERYLKGMEWDVKWSLGEVLPYFSFRNTFYLIWSLSLVNFPCQGLLSKTYNNKYVVLDLNSRK